MRNPGGNSIRCRLLRIASALGPDCGTGGMLRSVPETLNCFSLSRFRSCASAAGAASVARASPSATADRCRTIFILLSSGGLIPSRRPDGPARSGPGIVVDAGASLAALQSMYRGGCGPPRVRRPARRAERRGGTQGACARSRHRRAARAAPVLMGGLCRIWAAAPCPSFDFVTLPAGARTRPPQGGRPTRRDRPARPGGRRATGASTVPRPRRRPFRPAWQPFAGASQAVAQAARRSSRVALQSSLRAQ